MLPSLQPKAEDPAKPNHIFPKNPNNPEGSWTDSAKHLYLRSDWGTWNNYNEARVGNYKPIDLLLTKSGKKVKNTKQWLAECRPYIQHNVYNEVWGVIPPDSILPKVKFTVTSSVVGSSNTAYVEKNIVGIIDVSRYPQVRNQPVIEATLRLPLNRPKNIPVIIEISFDGKVKDYQQQYCFAQSWGICCFRAFTLQADNGNDLTSYVTGICNKGKLREPSDWGTLAVWGWGVSKLVDYFETDPDIDHTKVGVTGHSRLGKATLVSMANDSRIIIAFASCSGALGAKMSRRNFGETLDNVAGPKMHHWCAGNMLKWTGSNLADMPADAHSLMSLCAPRPIFVSAGTEDEWTDPQGMRLACHSAQPVYALWGKEENVRFHLHQGGHSDAQDWPEFVKFAEKFLKK